MDIWAERRHDTRMALALVGYFECRIMISNYKSFAAQSRASYSFPWYPSLPFLADRTLNPTQSKAFPVPSRFQAISKPFPNRSLKCQCRIIQIDSHPCPFHSNHTRFEPNSVRNSSRHFFVGVEFSLSRPLLFCSLHIFAASVGISEMGGRK